MANSPFIYWNHFNALILFVDGNFVQTRGVNRFLKPTGSLRDARQAFQNQRFLCQAYGQLPLHTNYYDYVLARNVAEGLEDFRKMECVMSIFTDAKTNKTGFNLRKDKCVSSEQPFRG